VYIADEWSRLNAHDMLGVGYAVPDAARLLPMPGLGRAAGPGMSDEPRLYHPGNPLFWFGVALVAAATGIFGASTKVKAGPYKAGAELGTT
jgi:hypothetical protein